MKSLLLYYVTKIYLAGVNKKPTAPTAPTTETYCILARFVRFKYVVGAVGFFSNIVTCLTQLQ